jgi:hypothetical protein
MGFAVMNRKPGLTILFIALIGVSNVLALEISVGVKKGDYIEYQVAFTVTPSAGHDVNWARMEIKEVQRENVKVEITSTMPTEHKKSLWQTLIFKLVSLETTSSFPQTWTSETRALTKTWVT